MQKYFAFWFHTLIYICGFNSTGDQLVEQLSQNA